MHTFKFVLFKGQMYNTVHPKLIYSIDGVYIYTHAWYITYHFYFSCKEVFQTS